MSFRSELTRVILGNGLKIDMTLWYFTFINYFLGSDAAGSAGENRRYRRNRIRSGRVLLMCLPILPTVTVSFSKRYSAFSLLPILFSLLFFWASVILFCPISERTRRRSRKWPVSRWAVRLLFPVSRLPGMDLQPKIDLEDVRVSDRDGDEVDRTRKCLGGRFLVVFAIDGCKAGLCCK